MEYPKYDEVFIQADEIYYKIFTQVDGAMVMKIDKVPLSHPDYENLLKIATGT